MTPKDLLKIYLQYLEQNPLHGEPSELYEPANYILNLGGKRVRPLLCLLGYNLFKNDVEEALVLAHAIEVFHNFTLIHDDIIDSAPLRRGFETVHQKWDVNRGILTGDTMLVRAYSDLFGLNATPEVKCQLASNFSTMAEDVCRGQQMDVNFESMKSVSEVEYIEMIRLKTSVLLGFSVQSGAILAGANDSDAHNLYTYGVYTGIAFQIMDDILDAFGGEQTGKQVGGDLIENKKTILLIELVKRASIEDLSEIQLLTTQKTVPGSEKVERLMAMLAKYEVQSYALGRMNDFFAKAGEILDVLQTPNSKKYLRDLTETLRIRTA